MEGNDTWSFSHPALHDNHSCSSKARNNYPACFTIYKLYSKNGMQSNSKNWRSAFRMIIDLSLHVNLKYKEWKISGSQSIAIATNDSVCDRCASVDRSI